MALRPPFERERRQSRRRTIKRCPSRSEATVMDGENGGRKRRGRESKKEKKNVGDKVK